MNVLQILMFAAIVLEVIFVPIFLKNEWPNRSYRSLAYKQLCSALFLVVGLCAIFHAKNYSAYSWLVLGALVGSFIGDALLHYEAIIKKKQFFLYGMIAFALSHILYLAAYAIAFSRLFPGQSPVAWYEILILILVLAAAALLMKPLQVEAGKLKIPMALYTAILAANGYPRMLSSHFLCARRVPTALFHPVFTGGRGVAVRHFRRDAGASQFYGS